MLRDFTDAVLKSGDDVIAETRQRVVDELGWDAMVDTAAVVANFQRMVRIADCKGIPLDEPVVMMSQSIREDLGLNDFHAAANTPDLPIVKRIIGKLAAPVLPFVIKRMAASRGLDD